MALATVFVVCLSTAGAAAPASAPEAAVSEKRTLGCGAGVVEISWISASPVQLIVFESNVAGAAGYDVTPAQAGNHAHSSDAHTLTWMFVDEDGQATQPENRAACTMFF